MSEKRLGILSSPGFLIGISVLLLNDFVLKSAFHNLLTGKLSDFAGLFVFPLFWTAFFPRLRLIIHILGALSFIIWKSAYSDPLIQHWNSLLFLPVGREADPSDLLALLVLPFAYFYDPGVCRIFSQRWLTYLMLGVSVFAFTATSYERHRISYDQKYYFQEVREELFERINRQQLVGYTVGRPPTCCPNDPIPDTYILPVRGFCGEYGADATIVINEERGSSVITLKEISYVCPKGESDRIELLKIFERDFIGRLR